MVGEAKRHERLAALRVDSQALFICLNCLVHIVEFPMAVSRVQHDSLVGSRVGGVVAEAEGLREVFLRLLVAVLLVVDDSDFIVDHGVAVTDAHRFLEGHLSSLQVVQFQVFHADI